MTGNNKMCQVDQMRRGNVHNLEFDRQSKFIGPHFGMSSDSIGTWPFISLRLYSTLGPRDMEMIIRN
jgi:hypothetical protein